MSGAGENSLTWRIRLASNRTKRWYKLQLNEEKRLHDANVERPILADPSEELPLYERMGALDIYRNGVLYLNGPVLAVAETPVIPPSDPIWWVTNFATNSAADGDEITSFNLIINSTNQTNMNYTARFISYEIQSSQFYNRNGLLIKDMSGSTFLLSLESLLTFTSNDGKNLKLLHFRGSINGLYNMGTVNFTRQSILTRIALSANRSYGALFYHYRDGVPDTSSLQILDTSDNILGQITSDISGGASSRYDSALIISDQNGNYITNASMRTTDLSDNNAGNSIAIRGINTFSDDSVILAGDFSTQEISFFSANNTLMDKLTLPVRKTNGSGNNRDIFMASFNSSGALRYYNYIRSTNQNVGQNEIDTSIAVDASDNTYMVGTFINSFVSPANTSLLQFFAKNKSSITPSSNIVYDTSGYAFNSDPNNSCNFNSSSVFLTKYNYSGDFQWFAPMGTNSTDLSGDVAYHAKTTTTGIVLSMLYASTVGSPSSTLNIYNGKTSAQRNTPGVTFRFVPLLNTSLFNNVIIKYNSDGTGSWVKQIRGDIYYAGPTSGPSITNIGHPIPLVTDSSNNIYNVCSVTGSPTYNNVQLWNIGASGANSQIGITLGPSSGSNPYIVSLSDSGALNWYGLINTTSGGGGTYCFNTVTTSQNELVLLCNTFSTSVLSIYGSTGPVIKTQTLSGLTAGVPYLLIYKLSSNGTGPGTTIKYIISQSTNTMNIRINNAMSIDSSNNLYITGELNSTAPAIGQTMNLINQDAAVVATVTKRSAYQYEYFTVKIPASFIQE